MDLLVPHPFGISTPPPCPPSPLYNRSDAKDLQSSLVDTWNSTFGNPNPNPNPKLDVYPTDDKPKPDNQQQQQQQLLLLPWKEALRPSLLHRLSDLSRRERREVKIPAFVTNTPAALSPAAALHRRGGQEEEKEEEEEGGAQSGEASSLQAGAGKELRGARLGRGISSAGLAGNGGVAGVLSGAGARRSFARLAAGRWG